MALIEHDLFRGRIDKVQMAIDRLRTFEPPEGYYLAYSGGKDSDTILELAKIAGVKFDAHYSWTTVDPPELFYHVKKHSEVEICRPKENMWQLIVRHRMPPTRLKRYCCEVLKESRGSGRLVVTGIRAEESAKRAKRKMTEVCFKDYTKRYLHPIIDWSHEDVWAFIRARNIDYCKLYDEGWKRLGCVMCPYSNMKLEAKRWPRIAAAYRRAIIKAYDAKFLDGTYKNTSKFNNGGEFYQWWLSGKAQQEDGGLFT